MNAASDIQKGLSAAEVAALRKIHGANELPSTERRSFLRIAFDVIRQPMFALLLCGGFVYLLLGDHIDVILLTLFATLSITIGVVQEMRSERVLEALRSLASPRALVVRDGIRQRIAGRDVVPGDIIILNEGDRVPADAMLLEAHEILADESLLTGESVPVRKRPNGVMPRARPGGEDLPFVFAGTLIAGGTGIARVLETGRRSEMGKIGQALQTIVLEQPRLQAQLRWLVRDFAMAGLIVAGLSVLLFGFLRGSWLQAGLGGIAIGMSVLPEEIPLVLAVFMAMGAWRISRVRVLTRRAAAIETLGSATVLCTDKTGTLTENRMRLELAISGNEVWHAGASSISAGIEDVLHAALGASAPLPVDPMDRAIHEAAAASEASMPKNLLRSYGIKPDLFVATNIWEADGLTVSAYAKGAPEAIAELCGFSSDQRVRLLDEVNKYAAEGFRLLAVAEASMNASKTSRSQSPRDIPFRYVGLIGFADPLRANVPMAVGECRDAGIRVLMITGDYPATARAIANQAGIDGSTILSGDELEALSEAELARAVQKVNVFARIRPQEKLKIVEALKRNGEIVAMTGDGVNDAPAMKASHIGISMGGRGTDVAREASSLVLLDDDFTSIARTIRLGRRIYDNLQKAIQYIIAVHIPIAGLALLPLLSGLPLMLLPIHIALLEMVIDPTCSVVFESEQEESDVMRRPPRKPNSPVLPRSMVLWAATQGAAALAIVSLALLFGARAGMPEADLRAFVFVTLVLANIGLIAVNRSFRSSLYEALFRSNPALWGLVSAVLSVMALAIYWDKAQALFRFAPLHFDDLSVSLAAGAVLVIVLEIAKWIAGTRTRG
jgi:Ca2+-transporting ATPase